MMPTVPERRTRDTEDLPTKLEHAFSEMSRKDKARFQIFGFGMLSFSIALPMVGGLFISIPGYYWLFSGVVMLISVCFLVPRLGVYLITSLPNGIAKIVPSAKLKDMITNTVDRRGEVVPEVPEDVPEVE